MTEGVASLSNGAVMPILGQTKAGTGASANGDTAERTVLKVRCSVLIHIVEAEKMASVLIETFLSHEVNAKPEMLIIP